MSDNTTPRWEQPADSGPRPDEGGLRAPPGLSPLGKVWWWFHFLILVKLARLRFIAVLVVIGLVIVKWDTILAYYDKWTRPEGSAYSASASIEYYCPMHPAVVRENNKEKCPLCFMPLSKREKGKTKEEALPPGIVNRVQLSPYKVVLAGIQTWKVAYKPLIKEITTVGFVEFDERKLKQVAARIKGRLDTLFVNEHGQLVHEGQELASLYSPDLVVTVQNLLDAQQNKNADLLRVARDRLTLWGIDDDQIEEILKTRKANTHLRIRSPIHGHIIKKYVKEGQYVEEGSPLYEVADLSTVWIEAQVYESDVTFLPTAKEIEKRSNELAMTAVIEGFPSETFKGKLTFVYPHVNQEARTAIARFELNNPEHKLRPGTTATVRMTVLPKGMDLFRRTVAEDYLKDNAVDTLAHSWFTLGGSGPRPAIAPLVLSAGGSAMLQQGWLLAVPEDAVIDTGSLQLVYREVVSGVPGEYEGVKVELGPRMVGPEGVNYYPVLRGLQPGDTIVTAGSFLVDAATRLNPAAGSIYFAGSAGKESSSGVSSVRPSTPQDDEVKVKGAFARLSSDNDRRLAAAQYFCPVMKDSRLGLMGPPVKLILEEQPVFLCCESCRKDALADPKETLAKVEKLKKAKAGSAPK
jgi:Cu(I)/Ag(I) efflux system membrane fusion protein